MTDLSSEPRAKRLRTDKSGRFAALEKLKQLKGSKNKYEVEEEIDNVYEIVDEHEYVKKAKERYGNDWIEDDGTGYAEDGRDFFEDEDEYSDEASQSTGKRKKESIKRPREDTKPKKGKGSIRNLFSNAIPKKKPQITSIAEDDVLADILGEMSGKANENVNNCTVKSSESCATLRTPTIPIEKSNETLAKEYMVNFMNIIDKESGYKANENNDDELIDRLLKSKSENIKCKSDQHVPVELTPETKTELKDNKAKSSNSKIALAEAVDFLDEDDDLFSGQETKIIEKAKHDIRTEAKKSTVNAIEEQSIKSLLSNWESICQNDAFCDEISGVDSETATKSETPPLSQENLKFWFWEAWEDSNKRPGEVFLFGKTAEGKSLCVRVENIERVLYLLPRENLLDPITKERTNKKVTLADLYAEFDKEIASELKLDTFRSRKVTKNFAYHSIGVDVPRVCDYLEIRYDGKKPAPSLKKKYNSIAHIFGTNTSYLEQFLLDRRIKGPCWLLLKQFKINAAPLSWCKADITVNNPKSIELNDVLKPAPPPPLTVLTIYVRSMLNPKSLKNEVCMISMLSHNSFAIDKPAPQPAFNKHMCGFTRPLMQNWPFDLNMQLGKYKATRVFKHDTERSLLSWFLAQYQQIDADLIVTHDAVDCQLDVLSERIVSSKIPQWSRLGRLRMSQHFGKKLLDFYIGRMVCDVKHSAEECIRSRSYDLSTLCQNVLKIKETERVNVNEEDLKHYYESGDGILKLVTLTMQDASYILRLMCELNIMPLALQITNICGNTMTRTLQAGRSERNEFLLLHAFCEKNYIVPDKRKREWGATELNNTMTQGETDYAVAGTSSARKKAAYSGGLVLDPIRGLYDKYVLLMDFNSLYPSIIQEYNICFTTVPQPRNIEDLPDLPDSSAEQGILPAQLRRLVESRREVKKLMTAPDLTPELKLQYHIRQMALKLTANSMYGCLGFAQSRFFAQHLAALVTHKGREILMNTKSLVQKMNYEVVYGDTDSIMINTRIVDYDQVFKIGYGIKQSVNKMYKQLELDIDGVFSCLLLLKKKKYAAVKVSKNSKGDLIKEQEHKGLDIVRRDWSQIAIMVGKIVLNEILSEKQLDDKLTAIHAHLEKVKTQIMDNAVPLPMFVITKQLSKAPAEFNNATSQSHVQVALRMNATRNRRYKKGDMVDYVICEDGSSNPATQRAYHLDELKSDEKLKLDTHYYLAHQIHPVVTRMVEVLEGTDAARIALCLGLDGTKYKSTVQRVQEETKDISVESQMRSMIKYYRQCEKFKFICLACKAENSIASAFRPASNSTYEPVLQKCANPDCSTAPYEYLISVQNQLHLSMRKCVQRFYANWLVCDDPACNQNTRFVPHFMISNRPICLLCKNGVLIRQYTETDLYNQLCYFKYMFDLSQHQVKNVNVLPETEEAYHALRRTVEQLMNKSAYCVINLGQVFARLKPFSAIDRKLKEMNKEKHIEVSPVILDDNETADND